MAKNMCLAANGGVLEDAAAEWHRDNNFTSSGDYVDGKGGAASATLYVRINGVWSFPPYGFIAHYAGSGLPTWSWDTGPSGAYANYTSGPYYNCTGIRIVLTGPSAGTKSITFPLSNIQYVKWGTGGNGNNDVARGYSMEMQAWGDPARIPIPGIKRT